MNITPKKFLKAKYGEVDFDCLARQDQDIFEINLEELLSEFKEILLHNIECSKNPRTGEYIVVNKDKSTIVGEYVNNIKKQL